MAIFNIYVKLPEGTYWVYGDLYNGFNYRVMVTLCMTARSPLQQLQNYGDSMGLTIGFIWVYGNFMGFNGVQ